jgi:hypothetical protein
VKATLDRHLSPAAFHLRISDTDFLICQPDLSRLPGQALCLRALREILQHFLGESDAADASIHQVLRLSPDGIEGRPVDVRAASTVAAVDSPTPRAALPKVLPLVDGALGPASAWTPFVTTGGSTLQVRASLDLVMQLRGHKLMGVRLSPTIAELDSGKILNPADIDRLRTVDLLKADVAALLGGVEALEQRCAEFAIPALIVPVHISTLSIPAGRNHITRGLTEGAKRARCGVICELHGVEGAPISVLQQAIAVVKPHAILVIAHIQKISVSSARPLKGVGLHALSTTAPPLSAALNDWTITAVAGARQISRSILVYDVGSSAAVRMCASLGVTHVSVKGDAASRLAERRLGDT